MIARARPAATLGAIQPQTSVHRTRRVAGLYAQGETDTERTQRTKRGPLGCRGKSSDAWQPKAIALTNTRGRSHLLPARCGSRAAHSGSSDSATSLCRDLIRRDLSLTHD